MSLFTAFCKAKVSFQTCIFVNLCFVHTLSPIIASLFGGFYVTFYVIFALLILSLALSTTIRQPEQKMLREAHGSL